MFNNLVMSCKQYQEEIDALNQVARHRPRSSLVLGIQQENRQIRELQHENKGKLLICNCFCVFYVFVESFKQFLKPNHTGHYHKVKYWYVFAEHSKAFKAIIKQIGVLSQFCPLIKTDLFNFPRRATNILGGTPVCIRAHHDEIQRAGV